MPGNPRENRHDCRAALSRADKDRRVPGCHLDLRVKRSYPFGFMGVDLIDAVGAISATVASHGHQMKASLTLFILSLLIGANGAHQKGQDEESQRGFHLMSV